MRVQLQRKGGVPVGSRAQESCVETKESERDVPLHFEVGEFGGEFGVDGLGDGGVSGLGDELPDGKDEVALSKVALQGRQRGQQHHTRGYGSGLNMTTTIAALLGEH